MELLAQRQLAQDSHHCPQGRPISRRFSRRGSGQVDAANLSKLGGQ
jgi:hypothetical protein